MGNVRTEQVKRIAKDLIRRFSDKFSNDFGRNKQVVNELVKGGTSKVRNQIAGYITHSYAVGKVISRDVALADKGENE